MNWNAGVERRVQNVAIRSRDQANEIEMGWDRVFEFPETYAASKEIYNDIVDFCDDGCVEEWIGDGLANRVHESFCALTVFVIIHIGCFDDTERQFRL